MAHFTCWEARLCARLARNESRDGPPIDGLALEEGVPPPLFASGLIGVGFADGGGDSVVSVGGLELVRELSISLMAAP